MPADLPGSRSLVRIACAPLVIAVSAAALPGTVGAQDFSRPVVQALPNPATGNLAEALRELGRDPQSVDALVRAGQASVELGDFASATNFFDRGLAVSPTDGRIKAGQASLALRQQRPVEALRLYDEAQAAGADMAPHAADRGMAYDLVGNNTRAQELYQIARRFDETPELIRRLALSQAIAGNQNASEATLLPLLQRADIAAYRTRAFTLAILGKPDEAVSIAETMLPERLSSRMAPYLRYMPRLTRAQQAAAADLGVFPRAADIGRDPPEIAALSEPSTPAAAPVQTADARLVPAGPAMGGNRNERPAASSGRSEDAVFAAAAARVAPSSAQPAIAAAAPQPVPQPISQPVIQPAPQPTPQPAPALAQAPESMPAPAPVMAAASAPAAPQPASTGELPPVGAVALAPTTPAPAPVAAESSAVAAASAVGPMQGPEQSAVATPAVFSTTDVASPAPTPAPAPVMAAAPAPVLVAAAAPDGAARAAAAAENVVDAVETVEEAPEPRDLAQAFADFSVAAVPQARADGAVDITTITPTREKPPEPKPAPPPAPPPPPPHPSRIWVQIATGRNVTALGTDWRRIRREADGLLDRQKPHVAAWGQTNRLVVGPLNNTRAANELVAALKEKGVDTFRFSSSAGEEVKALD